MAVLIDEKSSTKLAALFPSEAAAREGMAAAAAAAGIGDGQARLLTPADARASRRELFGAKVVPESTGIARTFFRSHLVLGLAGAVLGALAWWLARDHPALASTPGMSAAALIGFGAIFGMLLGGAITLRPDQVQVIARLRSGLRAGKFGVVFHPFDQGQVDAIRSALQAKNVEVMSSL